MNVPTADEARSLSQLLEETFPSPEGDEPLDSWLAVAGPLVASLTCRLIGDAAGESMEAVPTYLEDLAARTIVMKAEGLVTRHYDARARRKAIRSGNLQSISAGPWSESYFGPGEAAKQRQLDPDPDLAALLWALATPDCRDGWTQLWTGTLKPGAVPVAFEYSNRPGGYGASVPGTSEYLPPPR